VTESATQRTNAMAGAVLASWNPPGIVPNPHMPPPSAKCYTAAGLQGTSSSNLAWGSGSASGAVDQYMEDNGNDTTFGHRRWLMNPKLGQVGIGYYAGGGQYGEAQCMGVFDTSGTGPVPAWTSFPPPGFSPLEAARWAWTFHGAGGENAQMVVKRMSDNATLAMTRLPLSQGYGSYNVTAFRQRGWVPAVGQTYQVTVTGVAGAPISYEVKPADCK
jgi:hypothetical protein